MKKFLILTTIDLLKQTVLFPKTEFWGSGALNQVDLKDQKTRFLCTISSGQDSTVSFFLLIHINKKDCLQLLYCNHFWQIKNFVSTRLIFQMSYVLKVSYNFILPETILLTENESRNWRKNNFSRFSQLENIPLLLTGHTETDTVEKNLTNILRGTSPAGFSKSQILNYKKTIGVFFCTINNDLSFFINRENKQKNLKKKNSKSQKIYWIYLKTTKIIRNNKRYINRKNFNFSNTLKFQKTQFFGQCSNSQRKKIFNNQSLPLLNFRVFVPKTLRQDNLLSPKRETSKKTKKFGIATPSFNFFACTLNFNKKKPSQILSFSKQNLSYSFCFSGEVLKLKIGVKKPLETIRRENISTLIKLYKFPLVSDLTNFCSAFARNKIRHQLIPFSRFLVQSNVDYLFTNFFNLLNDQNKYNEKNFQKLVFVYKFLAFRSLKKKRKISNCSKSTLINQVSNEETRSLTQKLFFEYKNINLKSSHLKKLEKFSLN